MSDTYTIIFTTLGTLATATVAGAVSYIAGRSMKSYEWRLGMVREEIQTRQRLYAGFLAEADRLVLLSIENKLSEVGGLHDLFRRLSEIELLGSENVIASAKDMADHAMSSHVAGDKAARRVPGFHALKSKFIASVKEEMKAFGS